MPFDIEINYNNLSLENNIKIYKDICTSMFIPVLYIILKYYKHIKIGGPLNIHTIKYYRAIKNCQLLFIGIDILDE